LFQCVASPCQGPLGEKQLFEEACNGKPFLLALLLLFIRDDVKPHGTVSCARNARPQKAFVGRAEWENKLANLGGDSSLNIGSNGIPLGRVLL